MCSGISGSVFDVRCVIQDMMFGVSCWCFKLCVRVLGFDLVFVFRVGLEV